MKPLTQEWIVKAEGDFATATRELAAEDDLNYDAVCFHAQQCVEKYLKACLQEEGIAFAKTHDLGSLLDLVLPMEPAWAAMRPELDDLTSYAVDVRYPGFSTDKARAHTVMVTCGQVRHLARGRLELAS